MAENLSGKPALEKKQRYERLRGELENERASFIPHWRELNDYILPRRGRFTLTDRNRGERRSKNIIDSTATLSASTLSSGMMSGITNPSRPWFRLTTPDPDLAEFGAVKEWLHTVTQRMQTVFLRSNWYNVLPNLYYDLGVFGTSAMMIEEDERDVIRCTSFPVGSYFLANDHRGEVSVFMREFGMTVRQVVEKFTDGEDLSNLSTVVQNYWKDKKQTEAWVEILHVIMPNDEYDVNKLEAKYKPFISCYYERGSNEDKLLMESGYDEFPIMAPIWSVTGEDTYGTNCPGMTTLGDVKQLQLGEKKGMQAIEKLVSPPMVAPPGMRNFKLSLLPGDVSYVSESQHATFRPAHEIKPEIQPLEYKQEQLRQRIRRGWYEDLFLMIAYTDQTRGKQPVTAAEIAARQEEKLLALGPVVGQVERKLLNPGIDRVFPIMVRAGHIPVPPQELEGIPLKIDFLSVMAQAQKAVGISAVERFSLYVGSLAQAQAASPESPVWDKFDADQSIDEYADMIGVPPRVVVPDDEVQAVREQRAQLQQAAQAAELAASTAATAKTLSETDTEAPSALKLVTDSEAA